MDVLGRPAGGRRRLFLVASVMVVVLGLVGLVLALAADRRPESIRNQGLSIPDDPRAAPSDPTPPSVSTPSSTTAQGPPFAVGVASDGRHLMDQYGAPFLVRGDSPWSLLTDLSPAEAQTYFANRAGHGYNAALVSLIGSEANGGTSDDGATYDGIRPFVGGDVLSWDDAYWSRAHDSLRAAAESGITVFLFPIDGWTVGRAFTPVSIEQCRSYGRMVADWAADLPNIAWMAGGDYFPITNEPELGSDVDHCIDAMMSGITETGDDRLFSIQLGYDRSLSTENPYWAPRVDWNFVYTYYPTYQAVLEAYAWTPPMPAIMGEGNYEGENNQPDTPGTTDETLRRQVLWALTSGAAGDFAGSDDWEFNPGWRARLDTASVDQTARIRDLFAGLRWWELVPDVEDELVTGGRGRPVNDNAMDVLDDDYVTAAHTPDGTLAVVYVPTARTIDLDLDRLVAAVSATWVDPVSGDRREVSPGSRMSTPGANAGGDGDWILVLSADGLPG